MIETQKLDALIVVGCVIKGETMHFEFVCEGVTQGVKDLNIKYIVRNGENYKNVLNYQKKIKNVHIGKLPIMLKSDLCVLNQYKHLNHHRSGLEAVETASLP